MMKKIALTIQLCALLFTVYGQEQAFSISGDIELDKGQLLVLTQRPGKTDTWQGLPLSAENSTSVVLWTRQWWHIS
ncbi:MAG: hypothetical protein ACLU30_03625 [Odoribacter splanchnicus]